MTRDPAFALAEHIAHTRYADLPASAVAATRRDVIDTLGCILGGSGAPGIMEILGLLGEWGGVPESLVLLHRRRLPAPHAAMVNAAMGHALDFDDTHDSAGSIHPGISVLAASLAMADRLGAVSGQDFVVAVTLGLDVSIRIARAATVDRGWHRTAAIGVFGATAAAGRLLGLDAGQMHHALGIAYSHAAGNRQCILDGALTKRLQAGQAASAAVFASLLAARGLTGAQDIFTGRFGFFDLYQPGGANPALMTAALGREFCGEQLSFKPYPCGRPLHSAIDAALAARAALGINSAADIASAVVAADPAGHVLQFKSGPTKRRPTQVVEAQFAQPFLIATALVLGRVGIADVADLGTPEVLTVADLIAGEACVDRPKGWLRLTVQHRDGRISIVEATDPLGSPDKPLSDTQLAAKFRENAANAVLKLPMVVVDQTLERLHALDTLADTKALAEPLA